MNEKRFSIDRPLLILAITLIGSGLLFFLSASLSLLDKKEELSRIITTQIFLGLVGGSISAYIVTKIPLKYLKSIAFPFVVISIILTALLFVPGVGVKISGATRWINLGFISFQPAEILKYAIVIYYAAWLAYSEKKEKTIWNTLIPILVVLGVTGGLLLFQPDTDTFLIISITCIAMFFLSGAKWKYILGLFAIGIILGGILIAYRPYIFSRITTFMNPNHDPLGSSYQIRQSLIAVGSGGMTGRGFGQSVQKFKYLPEPLSDSIYAVVSEEFGFIGSIGLVIVYILFGLRGYVIAIRTNDTFHKFVVVGIVSLVVLQSLLNIASTIALVPLSGLPLVFVSHGGTALFFSLISLGIILNISQYQKTIKLPIHRR